MSKPASFRHSLPGYGSRLRVEHFIALFDPLDQKVRQSRTAIADGLPNRTGPTVKLELAVALGPILAVLPQVRSESRPVRL